MASATKAAAARPAARRRRSNPGTRGVNPAVADDVVDGSFAFGAVIAGALADSAATVTMPQWRVLVLTASGPQNVSAVAEDLQVHRSNATRIVERLVRAGLLDRRPDERDRRHVVLTLTPEGQRLVARVLKHRRRRFEEILAAMDAESRSALAGSMRALVQAAESVGYRRPSRP